MMNSTQPSTTPKPKRKSKTVWGLVTTTAGVLAVVAGMGPKDVAFLADGIQATDLPALAAFVGALLTAFGIRAANQPLQ